jgi:hypothetical protein
VTSALLFEVKGMERICETIKAAHEEISMEQVKAKVTVIPLHLTLG